VSDPIIGRSAELAAITGWLDAALVGSGRLVLCLGEPGIGKTRLAEELVAKARDRGMATTWGAALEVEGAPAYWPWRQVLAGLGVDPDQILSGRGPARDDRYRLFDEVTEVVLRPARAGLVVVLDDVHAADEPSLLLLRHLAGRLAGSKLLLVAAARQSEPGSALPGILPDLVRTPGAAQLGPQRFGLDEVSQQLAALAIPAHPSRADQVLDVTAGNPLFVREVARAIADSSWRADRPPRTVLDIVQERLGRLSAPGQRVVRAAAVAGRDFSLPVVAGVLGESLTDCLSPMDEAVGRGLVEPAGAGFRFVHALTRDAVEAALPTAERLALHRAVAEQLEKVYGEDLDAHLSDLARHWTVLAPYGEAATARSWTARAGAEAVRRLAFEEGARLYRRALDMSPVPDAERSILLVSLARALSLAGDLHGCADTAVEAADAADREGDPELLAEAALVVEAAPDDRVNAVAAHLGERALGALGETSYDALRARLLAQRVHLAFYNGNPEEARPLVRSALDLARRSGDDRAHAAVLLAAQEVLPGPLEWKKRHRHATELLAVARRLNRPRDEMWAHQWRLDALLDAGDLAAAAAELVPLQATVDRVGGPGSAALLDRGRAAVAQAQGRFADAVADADLGFHAMRAVEPGPAHGAHLLFHCALARHVVPGPDLARLVEPIPGPPEFEVLQRVHRAYLLLRAARPADAAATLEGAGPPASWSVFASFRVAVDVYAALLAAELGRDADLAVVLGRLTPLRGQHAHGGNAVSYLGPIRLVIGRAALALGRLDEAIADLGAAVNEADQVGARGFAAEARHHLSTALVTRGDTEDESLASALARAAAQTIDELGMSAYRPPASSAPPTPLSPRETEVARLVALGLTNRQISERLVISERTAQNHVQHILRKLDFATRSQIAAWATRNEHGND